jgi:predicted Zn-dependent peptidase
MLALPRSPLPARRARAAARFLLLAALVLLSGCASSLVPERQGLVMRDVSFTLHDMRYPSGLRVLVERDDRTSLVGLFLVVGAGSTSDPAGKEGHPSGRIVISNDLAATSASAATAWIEATHVPHNAVLAVVGEIDPKLVEAIVREQFEGWKDHASSLPVPPPPSLSRASGAAPRFLVTHRPAATQSQVRFGCLLPAAITSAIDTRHDVSARLIGDRLYHELRQKLGITYGFLAHATVERGGTAYLTVAGAVESGKLGPALVVLRDTLKALASAPAPDHAIARAKLRTAQREGTRFMTNETIVDALLSSRNVTAA